LEPGESYFDRLPHPVNDVAVEYDVPCSCFEKDQNGNPLCFKELPAYFPNVLGAKGKVLISAGKRRKARNIQYSDDLTDEDFELFKRFAGSGGSTRRKRAAPAEARFTKTNATRYCMERISNTDVGKLCAKLGANVQALVNSCSEDLEVMGTFFPANFVVMRLKGRLRSGLI